MNDNTCQSCISRPSIIIVKIRARVLVVNCLGYILSVSCIHLVFVATLDG